jgi:hypothetical protein
VVTQGQGWHVQGVCPQHDLLWDTLTAREHLNFYARLKRLSGAELVAGQFSGGTLMPSVHNYYC